METLTHGTTTTVSPLLRRLADEGATGTLSRDRGRLHLVAGRIVHAEAPDSPPLDVLLTTGSTLPAAALATARAGNEDTGAFVRALVAAGLVGAGTLELCHLGALHDAAYFALAPSGGPARFRYGDAHPLAVAHPVDAGAVERECRRRRAFLDRLHPCDVLDHAPLRRLAPGAALAVSARRTPVLALVDGHRTAPEIARALGRPAYHTLVDLRRLAAAGLVGPVRAPRRTGRPRHAAAPGTPPPPGTPPGVRAAPRPQFGAGLLPRVQDPDIALLRRLRDALEAAL
nr:hypothetical protein [Streptomyces sp. SPB074]